MGDAGEGLIDAEARIQERMEGLEHERARKRTAGARDPERVRALESLKLARIELGRQRDATMHETRLKQLGHAIAELDRRIAETASALM